MKGGIKLKHKNKEVMNWVHLDRFDLLISFCINKNLFIFNWKKRGV